MTVVTFGVDLTKNVFAVHGIDKNGKSVLVKLEVVRPALLELIANLPPRLIGTEACTRLN